VSDCRWRSVLVSRAGWRPLMENPRLANGLTVGAFGRSGTLSLAAAVASIT
jgi:hypothetical protein